MNTEPKKLKAMSSAGAAKKPKLSSSGTSTKTNAVGVSWQNSLENSKEKWRYLLDNHTFSDVTFLIGEDAERIPAHRLVLSLNSPVCEVMFNERWTTDCTKCQKKRAAKNGTVVNLNPNEIELPDLEPTAFKYFLRYIYTDDFEVPLDSAIDVLHVAEFFDLPQLSRLCKEIMFAQVNGTNALGIYEKTQRSPIFYDSEIERMCLEYVLFDAKSIFLTHDIMSLSQQTWCKLLKHDRLRLDEASLFCALYRWADAMLARDNMETTGENIRETLGPLLDLVRFPIMSAIEFTMEVADKNILTDAEMISVYKRISCNSVRTESYRIDPTQHQLPVSRFSEVPRHQTNVVNIFKTNSAQVIKAKFGWDTTRDKAGADAISFTIDRAISIIGLGVYAIRTAPDSEFDMEIGLWVVNEEGGTVVSTVQKRVKSEENINKILPILFPAPAQLQPGEYKLTYLTRGVETYYNATAGVLCKDVKLVLGGNYSVTFNFSLNPSSATAKHHIPKIYFIFESDSQ